MQSDDDFSNPPPLQLTLSPDGTLQTDPHGELNYSAGETRENQVQKFRENFNSIPSQFIFNELRLKKRCHDHGLAYNIPKLTDTVEATKSRRDEMNRAIKTAKQKERRKAMGDDKKKALAEADSIRRQKRRSRESPVTRCSVGLSCFPLVRIRMEGTSRQVLIDD